MRALSKATMETVVRETLKSQAIMFMMTEPPEVYRTIMKFISGM